MIERKYGKATYDSRDGKARPVEAIDFGPSDLNHRASIPFVGTRRRVMFWVRQGPPEAEGSNSQEVVGLVVYRDESVRYFEAKVMY